MNKSDKKRAKLVERIHALEAELRLSLQKKSADKAIDVSGHTRNIQALRLQLAHMA